MFIRLSRHDSLIVHKYHHTVNVGFQPAFLLIGGRLLARPYSSETLRCGTLCCGTATDVACGKSWKGEKYVPNVKDILMLRTRGFLRTLPSTTKLSPKICSKPKTILFSLLLLSLLSILRARVYCPLYRS